MLKIRSSINDISKLIFPSTCIDCGQELSKDEEQICTLCELNLPYTHFEKYEETSSLDQKFWGRVPLESTFALCYFENNKGIQSIIHELKYAQNKAIGFHFGKVIGERLKSNPKYADIDAIVPVPLHHQKEFIRGYNQTEVLAIGIQSILKIPVEKKLLRKVSHTKSQTKNNRFLRWEQAQEQFEVHELNDFSYKHIAIVDDVITTGSTLEGLIIKILEKYPKLKISIISLATTK